MCGVTYGVLNRSTKCGWTGREKLGREAKAEEASGGRGESGGSGSCDGSGGSERAKKKRKGAAGGDQIHPENARNGG